eukprot:tig00000339_g24169.t1
MGDLRKRGDEAKSQIEERYRKAQADKEYANRVIEERKQQAKENAARRNAEIEEQRRKIAERKAAEEEARKTKTLDRRVMATRTLFCATPHALRRLEPRHRRRPCDFDLERFTTKEQRDAFLGRPRARRPGVAKEAFSAETLFSAAGTANNDGMSFGAADLFQGAGIDLVGAGLGGTGSRAMRRAGAAAAGLGLATAGGLLSAYQALSQGKIGEAEFSIPPSRNEDRTVGGLGLSILAGAIAQVIVDIINGRSAEEIVKNFFKYPVDWAADTIQFIAQLSQQIYDWGVETWGDEASQLRNRINRLEGELGSGFLGVYDPSEAREMASLLAQELRLNEIKEPKELQAFIRALDNSINDYPHR